MIQSLYVNLPVQDLAQAKAFFASLGFSFNPQFEDQNAATLIVGENMYVMLLTESFYQTFTSKQIADARTTSETLLGIQLESRAAVDDLMKKVLAHGGKEAREAQDHGFMYSRSFDDLDGHTWEPFYMDVSAMPTPQE